MLKKHVVTKLRSAGGLDNKVTSIHKLELKGKKDEYEVNCYYNQGQIDFKKVKEILVFEEDKQTKIESRIKETVDRQTNKLDERIRQRKLRSDAATIKSSFLEYKEFYSPPNKKLVRSNLRSTFIEATNDHFPDEVPQTDPKQPRKYSNSYKNFILDQNFEFLNQSPTSEEMQESQDAI